MFTWLKKLFNRESNNLAGRKDVVTVICRECGKEITIPENVQHWPGYCQECRAKFRPDEPITRECRRCHKLFTFPANTKYWPRYCPECLETAKRRAELKRREASRMRPDAAAAPGAPASGAAAASAASAATAAAATPAAQAASAASEGAGGGKSAKAWTTLSRRTMLDTAHVSVYKNRVQLPDGAVIEDFYTVRIPDAAMIAALTEDGKILLKKEFRYPCGEEVIECPAGEVERNETDPMDAAKRELLEETGYTSERWTYLGPTIDNPSKLTNRMHLFLAEGCVKVAEQKLDENEHLSVTEVPFREAVDMVMDGRINANTAAHLILKVEKILKD